MSRLKTTLSLLGASVMALSVAACGGGNSEYCDLLKSSDKDLASLDPSDPDSQGQIQEAMDKITKAAPDDVKDDWKTFSDVYKQMVNIDYSNEEALAQLDSLSSDFDQASQRIGENIKKECDIEISGF